jgi:signal recognition particle receptor subunit beta
MKVDEAPHDASSIHRAREAGKGSVRLHNLVPRMQRWYARHPMASVNPHTRELVFKLVFYGPGLGGKTTTLQYIHAATKAEHRGKMVSLATPTDRTLYFDFLPIRVPRVRGMAVRLQLFTVPGQVYYAATRKLVLSGADGVVFVADSQNGRTETNQEALDDLHANLAEHNRTLAELPHTFHWNKRDLQDLVPVEDLERRFNKLGAPSLGTVATKGDGVFEGLERITRLVLKSYETDPKVSIGASADPMSGDGDDRLVRSLPEEGIAQALREMEEPAVIDAPTKISLVVPESGSTVGEVMAPSSRSARAAAAAASAAGASAVPNGDVSGESPRPPKNEVKGSGAWTKFTFPEPAGPTAVTGASGVAGASASAGSPSPAGTAPAAPAAPEGARGAGPKVEGEKKADSTRAGAIFSMSDMWPEADRESVRQAEAMMAARDAVNAILACDVLVTRVLASAAGLVGTLDAPRDPAVVALLLGLDGARYLHFRTSVRAARHREPVTMRDAFEGFTFALEARRARELLRR